MRYHSVYQKSTVSYLRHAIYIIYENQALDSDVSVDNFTLSSFSKCKPLEAICVLCMSSNFTRYDNGNIPVKHLPVSLDFLSVGDHC